MAEFTVNKIDAARRQIDTAIELLFENRDPVSIHTLATAGGRIVRDICEQRKTPTWESFKKWVRPGMERVFFAALQRAANFFKHADRDADEILDNVREELNDVTILLAIQYYTDLGNAPTQPMFIFGAWFGAIYPHLLLDDFPLKAAFAKINASGLKTASRSVQLALGLSLLRGDMSIYLKAS